MGGGRWGEIGCLRGKDGVRKAITYQRTKGGRSIYRVGPRGVTCTRRVSIRVRVHIKARLDQGGSPAQATSASHPRSHSNKLIKNTPRFGVCSFFRLKGLSRNSSTLKLACAFQAGSLKKAMKDRRKSGSNGGRKRMMNDRSNRAKSHEK